MSDKVSSCNGSGTQPPTTSATSAFQDVGDPSLNNGEAKTPDRDFRPLRRVDLIWAEFVAWLERHTSDLLSVRGREGVSARVTGHSEANCATGRGPEVR